MVLARTIATTLILRTSRLSLAQHIHRCPTVFTRLSSSSSSSSPTKPPSPPPWAEQPSPPRLSKEEQELFEELQRKSTGAFQTSGNAAAESVNLSAGELEELLEHPHLQKGEKPLFEGDVNPATGEVGGPKTDPLKYGDYAFNGRVTDF